MEWLFKVVLWGGYLRWLFLFIVVYVMGGAARSIYRMN